MRIAKKILLYFMLAVFIFWLVGGIFLFAMGNFSGANWHSIFLLQDRPFWSLVLLLLVGIIYWISANRYWVNWRKRFNRLDRITRSAVLFSAAFYINLLVVALLFHRLTDYSFHSDWSLLLVAAVPLLAFATLILIDKATSVKARFASIEVEFQRTITTPVRQIVTLEKDLVAKVYAHEIRHVIEEIQSRQEPPHILVVRFSKRRNELRRIEFPTLRDYVYKLSEVAPIEYIVFVDEYDFYYGYMTVMQFKARYPKYGIEILLEDLEKDKEVFKLWQKIFKKQLSSTLKYEELNDVENIQYYKKLKHNLILSQWDSHHDRRGIEIRDLSRLGAVRLYLRNPTVLEAYSAIVENKVPGIPVVDAEQRFLGIVTKDKVVQEVIMKLLKK